MPYRAANGRYAARPRGGGFGAYAKWGLPVAAAVAGREMWNQATRPFKRAIARKIGSKLPAMLQGPKRVRSGYSGGKLKARKKVRKRGRAYRKFIAGIQSTYEYGKVYTSPGTSQQEITTIGHINSPAYLTLENMWRTLFKTLLVRAGADVKDTTSGSDIQAADRFVLTFRASQDAGFSSETMIPGAGDPIDNMVSWAMDATRTWYAPGTTGTAGINQVQFDLIVFRPNSAQINLNAARLRMHDLRISGTMKSSLKVQNRTVTAALNVEADDIDNVPLHGRIYSGTGTGTDLPGQTTSTEFFGNANNGIINNFGYVLVSGKSPLAEPPSAKIFTQVTKTGKVKIEPGQIKTSVLSSKFSYKWNDMFPKFSMPYPLTNAYRIGRVGKFEFMVLEKILDSTIGINIVTAVEYNLKQEMSIVEKLCNPTMEVFKKVYG